MVMPGIDAFIGGRLEEMVEIAIDATPGKQKKPVVEGRLIRRQDDDAAAGGEHAMDFAQHAPGRKGVVLDHVRVSDEIEGIVGKRQRPGGEIAFAVVHTVLGGNFSVNVHKAGVIERRDAATELCGVECERRDLRADIENARRLAVRGSILQNVAQDFDFLAAGQNAVADPIGRMRSDARIARQQFENFPVAFERRCGAAHFGVGLGMDARSRRVHSRARRDSSNGSENREACDGVIKRACRKPQGNFHARETCRRSVRSIFPLDKHVYTASA